MSKLVFAAADIRRIVEHSINAPEQSRITDWSKEPGKDGAWPTKAVSEPTVVLVHDHGVYLMSNGTPRDTIKKTSQNGKHEIDSSFCAYAQGCDPGKDGDDAFENSNCLVGGDDFGEYLPWANAIKKALDEGAIQIVINYSQTRLSFSAKYQKSNQKSAS